MASRCVMSRKKTTGSKSIRSAGTKSTTADTLCLTGTARWTLKKAIGYGGDIYDLRFAIYVQPVLLAANYPTNASGCERSVNRKS